MSWVLTVYIYVNWAYGTKVEYIYFDTKKECFEAMELYNRQENITAYCDRIAQQGKE